MTASAHLLFDRALVRRRRARAANAAPEPDFLRDAVARDIFERLYAVNRGFDHGLALGGADALLRIWSGAEDAQRKIRRLSGADAAYNNAAAAGALVIADEERLPFGDAVVDAVVSALSLHTANDLPGALIQIRRALKPDGLLIAAVFGGETLRELRASLLAADAERGGAALRVAPFADTRALGGLLQRAGFAMPVTDVDRLTVRYVDPMALLQDLRAMGETSALSQRTPLTRGVLKRACAIYTDRYALPDGRVPATFDIVTGTGWAPHPSQQKPLQPGSAATRLADALGAAELSAGEKAGSKDER